MENFELFKAYLPLLNKLCWALIIVCLVILLYTRNKGKVISMKEVLDWTNSQKQKGFVIYVNRLSNMPKEVILSVHKEIGIKYYLLGYKDSETVFATITDQEGKLVNSTFFPGTQLDNDLAAALGNSGLKINC